MGNNHKLSSTKKLTISAVLSALGVVLLFLGILIDVLDLTTAVLASVFCIYAVIELGGAYPWMIWAVTSLLGMILIPFPKTPAIFYLFLGCYPILKEKLERFSRPVRILLKAVIFHVIFGLIFLAFWIFPELRELLEKGPWLVASYFIALVTFFVYDFALTRLISFYIIRLRNRFRPK